MNASDVGTTLRDMWETRPSRPRGDRKVAGVAAAIARRYDIDPVLVRVGFAVAAVYGIGVFLYVAGWILLPGADQDDPHDGAGPRASTPVSPWLWVLLAAVLIGSGGVFWGDNGGFVLPVLAVFGLLFLLHRSRSERGVRGGTTAVAGQADPDAPTTLLPAEPPGAAAVAEAPTSATGTDGGTADGTRTGETSTRNGTAAAAASTPAVHADPLDRGAPPEWDPLGAAPFAWDLPEPARPEPEPEPVRRKSRVTLVTLALALLGAGAAGAVVLLTSGLAGVPIVFATALAVIGVGLVVGSFTRGGRGLIPFALLLAVLTWGSVAAKAPLASLGKDGVGEVSVRPLTAAEVAPTYERGAGSIVLDLSGLDTSVPAGADALPIRTSANVGLGSIEVIVPPDADVTLRAHADLGDVSWGTTDQGGTDAQLNVVRDLGADGVASGRPIELDLQAGLGSVEVRRG